MSADNFIKFLNEHLTKDEATQKQLDQHKHSTDDFVRTLVEAGKANGYDFTADEALQLLPSEDDNTKALQADDGGLSEADLAAVAGGASFSFSTSNLSSTSFSTSFSSFGGFGALDKGSLAGMTSMCCW